MKRSLIALGAVACAAACFGGSGNTGVSLTGQNFDPAPTASNTINANPALDFNPEALTVARGTTVTFHFGSIAHNVTFTSTGSPANVPVSVNTSVGVNFPNVGTFSFHCTIHPAMAGEVIVQ